MKKISKAEIKRLIKPFFDSPVKHFLFELANNRDPAAMKKYLLFKVLIIGLLLLTGTAITYATDGTQNVYVHLVYLPVILACFIFRRPGVLLTALTAGLLLGPLMPLRVEDDIAQQPFQWLFRLGFFVVLSWIVSSLVGTRNVIRTRLIDTMGKLDEQNCDLELKVAERTKELEMANHDLELSNKDRQALIHLLCHDLQNPLGNIYSSMHMLREAQDLENRKDLEELIIKSAENGLNIIKMIRDIESFEIKKIDLEVNTTRLVKAVKESINMLKHQFKGKELSLNVEVDSRLYVESEMVSLINTVLNNILTNAIKFSKRGSKIHITSKKQDDKVTLSIRDTGLGIPRELLEKLFSLNEKTSREGTEGEVGTGFGMPLIKKFMNLYGGEIHISSKTTTEDPQNHGTEVTLSFKEAVSPGK